MIEAGAPSTEEATLVHRGGARPTGDSHGRTTRGPTQRFKDANQKPRQGGAQKRGQGHYRGWGPTPSFATAKRSYPSRGIATTLLHERLPWVTILLYPTASERGVHARCALLGTRSAGGGRRPGDRLGAVPIGQPLALAASRGPGLTHSTFPARKWRARGRIEHTLLDGEFSIRPNRPKTFARNHTIPHKSDKRFYLRQRAGVLRGLIQDAANGLLRILLLRTPVNRGA
jgi:hypothetical protein